VRLHGQGETFPPGGQQTSPDCPLAAEHHASSQLIPPSPAGRCAPATPVGVLCPPSPLTARRRALSASGTPSNTSRSEHIQAQRYAHQPGPADVGETVPQGVPISLALPPTYLPRKIQARRRATGVPSPVAPLSDPQAGAELAGAVHWRTLWEGVCGPARGSLAWPRRRGEAFPPLAAPVGPALPPTYPPEEDPVLAPRPVSRSQCPCSTCGRNVPPIDPASPALPPTYPPREIRPRAALPHSLRCAPSGRLPGRLVSNYAGHCLARRAVRLPGRRRRAGLPERRHLSFSATAMSALLPR